MKFAERVPQTPNFATGYFRNSVKHCIGNEEDLCVLYSEVSDNTILLWCDGRKYEFQPSHAKKRKLSRGYSNVCKEKGHYVEELAKEL